MTASAIRSATGARYARSGRTVRAPVCAARTTRRSISRKRRRSKGRDIMRRASLALLLPLMSQAANYTAKTAVVDGVDVVLLTDTAHKTEVTVLPSVGNM